MFIHIFIWQEREQPEHLGQRYDKHLMPRNVYIIKARGPSRLGHSGILFGLSQSESCAGVTFGFLIQ